MQNLCRTLAWQGRFCYNGGNEWEEGNMTRFFVSPEEMGESFLVLTGENAAHPFFKIYYWSIFDNFKLF